MTDGTIGPMRPWHDDTVGAALDGGTLHLPAVQYAAMVRIRRKEAVT